MQSNQLPKPTLMSMSKTTIGGDEKSFVNAVNTLSQSEIDEFVTMRWMVNVEPHLIKHIEGNGLTYAAIYQKGPAFRTLWNRTSPHAREEALQQDLLIAAVIGTALGGRRRGLAIISRFQDYDSLMHVIETSNPFILARCGFLFSIAFCLEGNKNLTDKQQARLIQTHHLMRDFIKHPKNSINIHANTFVDFLEKQIALKNEWFPQHKMFPELCGLLDNAIEAISKDNLKVKDKLLILRGRLYYHYNIRTALKNWIMLNDPETLLDPDQKISLISALFYSPDLFPSLTQNQCRARALMYSYHAAFSGDRDAILLCNMIMHGDQEKIPKESLTLDNVSYLNEIMKILNNMIEDLKIKIEHSIQFRFFLFNTKNLDDLKKEIEKIHKIMNVENMSIIEDKFNKLECKDERFLSLLNDVRMATHEIVFVDKYLKEKKSEEKKEEVSALSNKKP
ncbi:MAG: hypothetical protein ACD_44C00475G0007 [uncultured bacterium]|nr:MAG: hypothetical protein ACD_44C00475G0007 [uncultured bacterium]